MRGRRGEGISLTVRHEDGEEQETFEIVREVINIPSVLGDVRGEDGQWSFHVEGEPSIGYIRLVSFGGKSIGELESTLALLSAQGVRGLIIDLRENPGGLLDAAVDMSDMFLPAGETIVTIQSRFSEETHTSTSEEVLSGVPMVILVNENSASASEIVAGALQDQGRAVIAGERSFGKGSVQVPIDIEAGKSILKLTVAHYLRPSGRNIHRDEDATEEDEWGVSPEPGLRVELTDEEYETWFRARRDRDVPGAEADAEDSEQAGPYPSWDPQLQRAIEYLQDELQSPAASHPA
jgi:carboxyl-terminal processing protease